MRNYTSFEKMICMVSIIVPVCIGSIKGALYGFYTYGRIGAVICSVIDCFIYTPVIAGTMIFLVKYKIINLAACDELFKLLDLDAEEDGKEDNKNK